jgi:hypothetical protein
MPVFWAFLIWISAFPTSLVQESAVILLWMSGLIRKKTLEKSAKISIKRKLGKKPGWRLNLVSASFTITRGLTLTNAFAIV